MAPHFGILAWKISWTEELGGLQSKGLQSRTQLSACTHTQNPENSLYMTKEKSELGCRSLSNSKAFCNDVRTFCSSQKTYNLS